MSSSKSITIKPQSPSSILFSTSFGGCVGVARITPKANNTYETELHHVSPDVLDIFLFNPQSLIQLKNIISQTTLVLFVTGEYQKNHKGMWEMQPDADGQDAINRITAKIPSVKNLVIKAYDCFKQKGKPSNSLAITNDEKGIHVYSDGNSENPYTPLVSIPFKESSEKAA